MNHDNALTVSATQMPVRALQAASMLASVLLLAACANPPPTDAQGNTQECVYVRVTGSNLPVKECRSAEERAAIAARNREAAEQGVEDLRKLDEFGVESAGAASLD